VDRPLAHGSYLLRVAAPGCAEVAYPVLIERGERWDGCPPGSGEPYPIPLVRADELGADELYVPAGWGWTGDPEAQEGLPRRRVWIDGFVVGRFPVTNEEYLAFLNDLIAEGREEEALAACPRPNRGTMAGADEQLSYDLGPDGRFRLKAEDPGEVWKPRGPAVLMTWHGAMAYARWIAARSGLPYRLPDEFEREKAAAGVDGRVYPWGDHFDPTWARVASSHPDGTSRVEVDGYPLDESPYGLRGGAGNTRDFCLGVWRLGGPVIRDGRLVIEPASREGAAHRSARGGAWVAIPTTCRTAARFASRPEQRWSTTGLRMARSFP
jgi:serine/threonine-protein kinase